MGIPNHTFTSRSWQTAHRLTSWLSYRPDVITLIVTMMHGRQWATAFEAYHFVPINSPSAPSGWCQPARSLCHYSMRFVWTTLKNSGSQQRQQAKRWGVIEGARTIHGGFIHDFTTSKRQNYWSRYIIFLLHSPLKINLFSNFRHKIMQHKRKYIRIKGRWWLILGLFNNTVVTPMGMSIQAMWFWELNCKMDRLGRNWQ
jgi:hypothetical protein